MSSLISGTRPKNIIYTYKNTKLADWIVMVAEAFKQRNYIPSIIKNIIFKQAWESGETPMSFADKEIFRNSREIRNTEVKRLND
jgi:hypothetical protein